MDSTENSIALKNSVLFLILSKLLKKIHFFNLIKLYEYLGNFQSSYETKKIFYGKDTEANH